jgi:hypothetical protein
MKYCGPEQEDWRPEEYYGENDADETEADEYEEDNGSAEDEEIEWDGKYTPA